MTNEEQLEIREYLAKAMGWIETYSSKWTSRSDGLGEFKFEPPNPFTSASDLLELVEWTRKQRWLEELVIDQQHIQIVSCAVRRYISGSFQEAFPLAVYQALKEVENGRT